MEDFKTIATLVGNKIKETTINVLNANENAKKRKAAEKRAKVATGCAIGFATGGILAQCYTRRATAKKLHTLTKKMEENIASYEAEISELSKTVNELKEVLDK